MFNTQAMATAKQSAPQGSSANTQGDVIACFSNDNFAQRVIEHCATIEQARTMYAEGAGLFVAYIFATIAVIIRYDNENQPVEKVTVDTKGNDVTSFEYSVPTAQGFEKNLTTAQAEVVQDIFEDVFSAPQNCDDYSGRFEIPNASVFLHNDFVRVRVICTHGNELGSETRLLGDWFIFPNGFNAYVEINRKIE